MISDLPRDLAERVLSRLPVTSLRGVRSISKKWNTLSKDQTFIKRHISEAKNKHWKEFQVVMMLDFRVYLFTVNLLYPSIERIGKLITLADADRINISQIFHCDGLLLCITKDTSLLVVWNPCTGQTRFIEPPRNSSYHILDRYALGYERKQKDSLRSHKVLRFVDYYDQRVKHQISFEIYNLDSNSWNVVDVKPDWDVEYFHRGVSLNGNTYWYAQEKPPTDGQSVISDLPDFLLCFDFTTETFVPRLPLPFHAFDGDTVTLSSVTEEQLAVLCQKCGSPAETVEIWITTKIEPNAVSWSKFLTVDMKRLIGFRFLVKGDSFFVDEMKKVAVVLDKDRGRYGPTRNIAYIIGEEGYFKQVDLGKIYIPTL